MSCLTTTRIYFSKFPTAMERLGVSHFRRILFTWYYICTCINNFICQLLTSKEETCWRGNLKSWTSAPAQRFTRALIRRGVKRAGPSKKVWCSRLGSTKTRRLLTLELRFRKKLHETPFYVNQELLYCIFDLWQWEKVSFSGMKQDL